MNFSFCVDQLGGCGGSGNGVTTVVGWGDELGPGTKPELTFVEVVEARSETAPTVSRTVELLGGGGGACGAAPAPEAPPEDEELPVIS